MNYSVAIRTLGKAGDKYERLLRSVDKQTVAPDGVFVYIAEGYALPPKVSDEVYVRCAKGMVHQRAIPYDEITSDFILLCDDDIELQPDSVEKMMRGLEENEGDAIAANLYFNHKWSLKEKFIQSVFHGLSPSLSAKYAYPVRRNGYFRYSLYPREVMETQCFPGGCVLIRKEALLAVRLADECWMDQCRYTLGDDQLLAYKLYRYGYKVLIHSNVGIIHLDAQSGHETDKYKDFKESQFLQYIIWYRSIYQPDTWFGRRLDSLCFYSRWCFRYAIAILSHLLGRNRHSDRDTRRALKDGKRYVRSEAFLSIPKWEVTR